MIITCEFWWRPTAVSNDSVICAVRALSIAPINGTTRIESFTGMIGVESSWDEPLLRGDDLFLQPPLRSIAFGQIPQQRGQHAHNVQCRIDQVISAKAVWTGRLTDVLRPKNCRHRRKRAIMWARRTD